MHDDERRSYSVAVVDDSDDVRQLLRLRLDLELDLHWAGEARDGVAGITLVRERRPDAVILNSDLPRLDGLAVLTGLRDAGYDGVVVMYTASAASAARALAEGADGAVQKTEPVGDLLELVMQRCYASAS